MSLAMEKFELRESDLELVVNEKTLGSLTTNAKQIKSMIEAALPCYDISNYNDGNIDRAKKDKAMLNNASKALNDKRIQFEKEFMQPFSEFKTVVGETVQLIKECSSKIDTVVKQSEENERQKKQEDIALIWSKKNFTLVSLDKISDQKWLNKTTTLKAVEAEIDKRISGINDDIATIEAIGADTDLLKSIYLDTLNLNSTIQYANTLKQNRERASAEAAARAKPPEPEQPAEVETALPQTEAPAAPTVEYQEAAKAELLTRAFKITASRENIIKLSEFMKENGIVFEKIQI